MKVKKKCCGKCLFGANKIVTDKRKDSILKDCQRNDTYFTCHEATIKNEDVVCSGFYHTKTSQMIRVSERLNMIEMVD